MCKALGSVPSTARKKVGIINKLTMDFFSILNHLGHDFDSLKQSLDVS
jgi:hypothetical protein